MDERCPKLAEVRHLAKMYKGGVLHTWCSGHAAMHPDNEAVVFEMHVANCQPCIAACSEARHNLHLGPHR